MNNDFRKDFPIFSSSENKGLIYFDNAATTQKPFQVIEAVNNFYKENNANPMRGLYSLSSRATQIYENARKTTANFINASYEEIIFTRNASESFNLIAYSWGLENINEGDEIVVSIMEHHSNILPWQMLCKAKGAKLIFMECTKDSFEFPEKELNKITHKTKLVSITQISNVLGCLNPVKKIIEKAHNAGALAAVDAAQSVAHIKIDVKDLDADFLAFSGHKMCAPMGIGVLYGKKEILEKMPPFMRGGEMIEYVTRENAVWAELPQKFEAGTVNAAGAAGLEAAIKYIQSIGFEKIAAHDNRLSSILMEGMKQIPYVKIIGTPEGNKHLGIVTFVIEGVHPHDTATILNTENIAIRAGHHCAHPLGAYLNLPSTARASMYFYNTEEEVNIFLEKLAQVRKWMGYGN